MANIPINDFRAEPELLVQAERLRDRDEGGGGHGAAARAVQAAWQEQPSVAHVLAVVEPVPP